MCSKKKETPKRKKRFVEKGGQSGNKGGKGNLFYRCWKGRFQWFWGWFTQKGKLPAGQVWGVLGEKVGVQAKQI